MASNELNEVSLEALRVKRERLSEQVADQIQELIITGGLKPGSKLPPERELCEQLGVSRTVIREATKALQERGLVKVLTGSGTYVSKVESGVVSQSLGLYVRGNKHTFRDLLEIRKSLEVEIAGLAAERATEEDIEQLKQALEQMQEALPSIRDGTENLEEFVQADLLFHEIMAKASKNSLLPLLLTPITDLLFEFSRKTSALHGAPESAVAFHQTILECILSRNSKKSREVMRAHMSNAEEFLERVEEIDEDYPVLGLGAT